MYNYEKQLNEMSDIINEIGNHDQTSKKHKKLLDQLDVLSKTILIKKKAEYANEEETMNRSTNDYHIYKKIADDNKESLLTMLTIRLNSLSSDAHTFESAMGDVIVPGDIDTDEDLLKFLDDLNDTRKDAWLNLLESFADVYIYSRAFMERAGISEALVRTRVYELLDKMKEEK